MKKPNQNQPLLLPPKLILEDPLESQGGNNRERKKEREKKERENRRKSVGWGRGDGNNLMERELGLLLVC